jgi:hypothetical protein
MINFNLNVARSYVGCNVNLHPRDGSVIVNVLVTEAIPSKHNGGAVLRLAALKREKTMKIMLKEVAWAEKLNPYILS